MKPSIAAKAAAIAGIVLGGLGLMQAAQARTDVVFTVGVQAPAYYAPQPYVVAPAPVYVAPRPITQNEVSDSRIVVDKAAVQWLSAPVPITFVATSTLDSAVVARVNVLVTN